VTAPSRTPGHPLLRLFELRGEHCAHALLVRLPHHPEEQKQIERLVHLYGEEMLKCGPHETRLEGQYEGPLTGDAVVNTKGRQRIDLWIAAAQEGAPWMVPASAPSEQAYWAKMTEQASSLPVHPVPPAIHRRPFLLTDSDL
jgi:hypothetical protein